MDYKSVVAAVICICFGVLFIYGKHLLVGSLALIFSLPQLKSSSIQDGGGDWVLYSQGEKMHNFGRNFNLTATVYYPRTVDGLRNLVLHAKDNQLGLQMIGTRHTWNNLIMPEQTGSVLLVSLIPPAAADSLNLYRPEFKAHLETPGELASILGHELRNEGGEEVCIVEAGAGTLFLQLIYWAQKHGYFLKNSLAPSRLTLAGGILTHSHGSGLAEPALPVNVVGLKYIDVSGSVVELSEEGDIDTYISSFGILGPAVSFKIRLQRVGHAEVERSISSSLETWIPRPPAKVAQSTIVRLLRSDYQQFILLKFCLEDKAEFKTIKWIPAEPPLNARTLENDQDISNDFVIFGLIEDVFHKMTKIVKGLRDPLTYVLRGVLEKSVQPIFPMGSHSKRVDNHLDTIHPIVPTKPFRVFEYCFPVYKTRDEYDFSIVQLAVWDALDASQRLSLGTHTPGIDDHFDIRFVKPSHLTLSPYPRKEGVGFWACMCASTGIWTPEDHRARLMEEITAKWKSYSHNGQPVNPRPHWAKDMPSGETEYLKEVYAAQLNSLRPKLEAMASKSSSGGAGGGGLNLALKMFGNKMTKELLA